MSNSERFTDKGRTSVFYDGAQYGTHKERERIIKLLEPLAEHDEEACYHEGKLECWPDDCSANQYQFAIDLIKGETNA